MGLGALRPSSPLSAFANWEQPEPHLSSSRLSTTSLHPALLGPSVSPLCHPGASQKLHPVHASCLPVHPSLHRSAHPVMLSVLFASIGPTLSIRSWGWGHLSFPVTSQYHPVHVPASGHESPPGLQRNKLATRPQPRPSLTQFGQPGQSSGTVTPMPTVSREACGPPTQLLGLVCSGAQWAASVLPCLCRPCLSGMDMFKG